MSYTYSRPPGRTRQQRDRRQQWDRRQRQDHRNDDQQDLGTQPSFHPAPTEQFASSSSQTEAPQLQ